MVNELRYNGYSANPSDYECQDGDMALSINMIPEDGALRTILSPAVELKLEANCRVLYIHETISYKHYIVLKENNVYWITDKDTSMSEINKIGSASDVKQVSAVGNTLIILKDSINYYLWKMNKYISLGDHLPNIEMSFGLRGRPRLFSRNDESKSTFKITFDKINKDRLYEPWSSDNQKKITEQVMAKVNKFLADQTVRAGKFALPFMLRYALRMYDGSLVCHSAPILMNPSTTTAPVVMWQKAEGDGGFTEATCNIMLVAATIDYKLCKDRNADYVQLMEYWGDIIKSIDVFITKPIYTYDQNGLCKSFSDTDNLDTKFIGALDFDGFYKHEFGTKDGKIILPIEVEGQEMHSSSPGGKENELGKNYVEWEYAQLYRLFYSHLRNCPDTTINLPEYTQDKNNETLSQIHDFYFLHSIPLNELSIERRQDIVVKNEYLQSLVNREVMKDDYLTHDRLMADYAHTYNNRLNLSGLKRQLFRGFTADSMFACITADAIEWQNGEMDVIRISFYNLLCASYDIEVYIKEDNATHRVISHGKAMLPRFETISDTTGILHHRSWGCYLFYPNNNAFKMYLKNTLSSDGYEIDLKPHDFLNGAYAAIDYDTARSLTPNKNKHDGTGIVSIPNKIYTSEVNNPFYFPLLGINSVGTGKILGISTASKALSEGQFGQFPLYAFTSEGVWALEVSASGTYSAKQPITRDVVINPDSITQIDSAVLFVSDRGIMLISGSEVQCISNIINSQELFQINSLPKYDKLIEIFNSNEQESGKIDNVGLQPETFNVFLKKSQMLYDYPHQRIIVFNPEYKYAYVYSMKSQQWGMMRSNIAYGVNSYPEALAMDNNGNLVNLSLESSDKTKGLLITRPFKMNEPNIFKTISTIIQRGNFIKSHINQILYASNDLENWHVVWSSSDAIMRGFRGTPYKYFRLALICNLDKSESIYGCSIQYEPRLLNQLR